METRRGLGSSSLGLSAGILFFGSKDAEQARERERVHWRILKIGSERVVTKLQHRPGTGDQKAWWHIYVRS